MSSNLLLDSLPELPRKSLLSHLKAVELKQHVVLFETSAAVDMVYFPLNAVISLVVPLSNGITIEAAMVGRDGVVGAAAAVNGRISLNRAVVQLGGQCLQCEAKYLKQMVDDDADSRTKINAHEQALFGQAQQSAACNVTHKVESRLARWLLRARDLSGKDQLDLTQEYLGEMLGVGRPTVSLIAQTLQTAGLITYRRGHIRLSNIEGLQEVACECYAAVKMNYDALMKPSN